MTALKNKIKLDSEYSYCEFNDGYVTGELHVIINDLAVCIEFESDFDAEGFRDYDGHWIIEYGGLNDIKLNVSSAWTVEDDGDTIDQVEYEIDADDLPTLHKLVTDLYVSTEAP